jgi:predicted dehydrogenase
MQRYVDPVISKYLSAQPSESFGIEGVRVTHIWCDEREDARRVAEASKIPNVVERADALIGQVDAVLIPTDIGQEHVRRATPFIDAGVPVFIDKPLCDTEHDLNTFAEWIADGRSILSCSAFRFAAEFESLRARGREELGELRLITMTIAKSWRRYGIHALEGVYPFLEPGGWLSATNSGREGADVVHFQHASGADVIIAAVNDLFGGFGVMHCYGTRGHATAQFRDSFTAFKRQLSAFVDYLRTGVPPFPFEQTRELIALLIAAEASRRNSGRPRQLTRSSSGSPALTTGVQAS